MNKAIHAIGVQRRSMMMIVMTRRPASQQKHSVAFFSSFPPLQLYQRQRNGRTPFRTMATLATATYDQSVDIFPSIVIGPNKSIVPQGPFAEAQAQYLDPDPEAVAQLKESLLRSNMGIVAHYYMDVELQGVLTAVQRSDPRLAHRIGIADSLKMGDLAVAMCTEPEQDSTTASFKPVSAVACLGVDFMSESVAAIMARNGYGHIPVYRATSNAIGCSLAESAERDSYRAWLEHYSSSSSSSKTNQDKTSSFSSSSSSSSPAALHVVYINTSLETKAVSTSIVPTITCTSSNVLQTMLQASAQVGPELSILYGPDTYMGHNLQTLLDTILDSDTWDDDRIAKDLHPRHSKASLGVLRKNLHVYPNGNCVVHHMFGNSVVETVQNHYEDAYVTAHLEVPGEMFTIAMQKSLTDHGVVGSTSDILTFISRKVNEVAMTQQEQRMMTSSGTTTTSIPMERLQFILGTEAGMVTSIVKSVQDILAVHENDTIEVEIVFPVSSEAVMGVDDSDSTSSLLGIVPGAGGGEGCSTAGGCATCPFMKMNSLDALQNIMDMVEESNSHSSSSLSSSELTLKAHLPPDRLRGKRINGMNAMDLGVESIMYMRDFMTKKEIPQELVTKILNPQTNKEQPEKV